MFSFLLKTAITLGVLAFVLPTVQVFDWVTLVLASIVFAVLFGLVRPVLKLLLLPINFVTLGFASFFVNAGLLWLVTYLVPGFQIQSMTILGVDFNYFWSLIIVSAMISLLYKVVDLVL